MRTLREFQADRVAEYLSEIDVYPQNVKKVAAKIVEIVEIAELDYIRMQYEMISVGYE